MADHKNIAEREYTVLMLSGLQLDWAVAFCAGMTGGEWLLKWGQDPAIKNGPYIETIKHWSPSTRWGDAWCVLDDNYQRIAVVLDGLPPPFVEDLLLHLMRCFVVSVKGHLISMPDLDYKGLEQKYKDENNEVAQWQPA